MWPKTREKVEFEITQLQRLVDAHRPLLQRMATTEPDAIELSALSAYLHSFYNGIENILRQVAADVDGVRPAADRWHADLLALMAATTEDRAPLISEPLLAKLTAYMGFRHVFRHSYTFDLSWRKMHGLVLESEGVLAEIIESCRKLFV